MEKLQMCRICLVQNVHMHVVVNQNLHDIYEQLTNISFVTEDSRPMFACFICYTKLKQCCRFLRKCMKAEEMFTRMLNEDYEPDPLLNNQMAFYNGFIQTPIETISIVDVGQTESVAIKEELPSVCDRIDDIIEPRVDQQSAEMKLENVENKHPDVEDIPVHFIESSSEYEVPLIKVKIEVEDVQLIGSPVMKKPKLDTRRTKQKDKITTKKKENRQNLSSVATSEQKNKNQQSSGNTKPGVHSSTINSALDSKKYDIRSKISDIGNDKNGHRKVNEKCFSCDICQRSFSQRNHLLRHTRHVHANEQSFKCHICERSFIDKTNLTNHIRIHTGDKPFKCGICQRSFNQKTNLATHNRVHTGEKPFKCDICQRSFCAKVNLARHITRVHTSKETFKCDLCERNFTRKNDLICHSRKHTGEKPFKCDICQRRFNLKRFLSKHTRLAHS